MEFAAFIEKTKQQLKFIRFGIKQQQNFLEYLHALVSDGIPVNRAIDMLAKVDKGVSQEVALTLSHKISEGQPLAQGMREWFPTNIVEIIRAGEEGGALAETLASASTALSQKSGALSIVIGALLYPLTVIGMALGVMIYLNKTVFVTFRQIKPITQWPAAGQQLVELANFIQAWWWLSIAAFFVLLYFLKFTMDNYVGDLRPKIDKIPPFSLYRKFVASRFMETLGLLVANGVVFKAALKILQYHATPYLISHLLMMEHLLGKGQSNIANVLETGLLNEQDLLRLKIIAEVKGFEHSLIRLGKQGAEQNLHTVRLIAKIMGGFLLFIGAILIIVVIRGIYLTGMSMGT